MPPTHPPNAISTNRAGHTSRPGHGQQARATGNGHWAFGKGRTGSRHAAKGHGQRASRKTKARSASCPARREHRPLPGWGPCRRPGRPGSTGGALLTDRGDTVRAPRSSRARGGQDFFRRATVRGPRTVGPRSRPGLRHGRAPPLDPGHRALILLGGALAGRRIHKSYFALCALPSEPRVGRALPVLDTCLPRPSYGALLRTGAFSPADLGQPPRSDPGRDRDHGTARSRPDRGHAVALSRSRGSTPRTQISRFFS